MNKADYIREIDFLCNMFNNIGCCKGQDNLYNDHIVYETVPVLKETYTWLIAIRVTQYRILVNFYSRFTPEYWLRLSCTGSEFEEQKTLEQFQLDFRKVLRHKPEILRKKPNEKRQRRFKRENSKD